MIANKFVKVIFSIIACRIALFYEANTYAYIDQLHSLITLTNTLSSLASKTAPFILEPKTFFADFINKFIDKKVDLTVPKIIHYIWLGGPIYEEYWLTITKMATIARANGYKVWVWVDNPRNLRSLKAISGSAKTRVIRHNDTYQDYVNKFKSIEVKSIYNLKSQINSLNLPSHFSNDFWKAVKEEMVGLKNYAAASDLLRYLILFIYGGIYFDTDEKILSSSLKIPKIGTITLPYGFMNISGTNSILMSIKGHPLLSFILLVSLDQLNKIGLKDKAKKRKYGEPGFFTRKDITISITGPGLVRIGRETFAEELARKISKNHDENKNIYDKLSLNWLFPSQIESLWQGKPVDYYRLFHVFQIGAQLLVQAQSDQTWLKGENPRFVEE